MADLPAVRHIRLSRTRRSSVLPGTHPDRTSDCLERIRISAGLTHAELWLRYFELGGMATPFEVEAYLSRVLHAAPHDRTLLAAALDERVVELGGQPLAASPETNAGGVE